MHGLIFTGFRHFTHERFPQLADAVWRDEPTYLAVETYPDEDFVRVLRRTADAAGASYRDVERQFGMFAAETTFRLMHPDYYAESGSTRQFLLDVESRIHELVRATIPGAAPPRLQVVPLGAGVSVTYMSDRRLCALLDGLLHGTARHYGERYRIEEASCMENGDLACVFHVLPA